MFRHDDRESSRLLRITLAASVAIHGVLALSLAGATVVQPGTPPDDRDRTPMVEVLVEDVARADVES